MVIMECPGQLPVSEHALAPGPIIAGRSVHLRFRYQVPPALLGRFQIAAVSCASINVPAAASAWSATCTSERGEGQLGGGWLVRRICAEPCCPGRTEVSLGACHRQLTRCTSSVCASNQVVRRRWRKSRSCANVIRE